MYEPIRIRSYRHEYSVNFVSNIISALQENIAPQDVVFIDNSIMKLYPDIFTYIKQFRHFIISSNESVKTYQNITSFLDPLIRIGFTKSDKLIAIGGGITQDITSFIASILLRGVKWYFFPTNLLAQSDSCIGSKTSINFGEYKNQLGSFFPPHEIFISTSFLNTLPNIEIHSGMGEMLHYFCVAGRDDLDWAIPRLKAVNEQRSILDELIYRSLSIKKNMIEIDEFDKGPRNVFNYGHSFGHALETATNFAIPHGIAVCFGMDLANTISANKNLISPDLRNELRDIYEMVWREDTPDDLNISLFFDSLSKDKKNEGAEIKVILTRGLGAMFKTTLTLDDNMHTFIETYFYNKVWGKAL